MAKKETLKKVLIEIASVVFAVLLALGLNHWREDLADEALAEQALKNIVIEIRSNMRDLEAEFTDYEAQRDTLRARRQKVLDGDQEAGGFGYNHPILYNSAWRMANSTGAVKDLDLDVVMELSALYIMQETHQKHGFDYFRSFTSLDFQKPENKLAAINSNLTQLTISMSWGRQLMEGYKSFLTDNRDQLIKVVHPDSLVVSE